MPGNDTEPDLTQRVEAVHISKPQGLILSDLLTEVLLCVFSHCDYLTLKENVSLVCRRFRTIVRESTDTLSQGKLAEALFVHGLARPIEAPKEGSAAPPPPRVYTIHPCFQYIQSRLPEAYKFLGGDGCMRYRFRDVKNLGFISKDGRHFTPLNASPVASENAFAPGYASMTLKFLYPPCWNCRTNHGDSITHTNPSGKAITVADLAGWISDAMMGKQASVISFKDTELTAPFVEEETGEEVRYYTGRCMFEKVKICPAAHKHDNTLAPEVSFWHYYEPSDQPAQIIVEGYEPNSEVGKIAGRCL